MKQLISILLLIASSMFIPMRAQEANIETSDSLPPLTGNWIQQLMQANFNINDPRIHYPKFANFCRNVYNWGDKTFNTYDKDYVVGTGKNWKFNVDGTVWQQSYGYIFDLFNTRGWDQRITLHSNFNYDIGVRLSFMAVSIGYTWNVNQLAKVHPSPRSTFDFAFSCALFTAELRTQTTSGNTRITHFGQYNNGERINVPFDDINTDLLSINAYYFFNHKKFSQAAVYKFSKYQKKSSGSWMLGASFKRQKIEMDFSSLPPEMMPYMPENLPMKNHFHYRDFNILCGYSYNAVMPHNWIYNITILPGIGFKRSLLPGEQSISEMLSANMSGKMGFTYNHKALFANLTMKFDGSFVFNSKYSFINSTQQISLVCGVRF